MPGSPPRAERNGRGMVKGKAKVVDEFAGHQGVPLSGVMAAFRTALQEAIAARRRLLLLQLLKPLDRLLDGAAVGLV